MTREEAQARVDELHAEFLATRAEIDRFKQSRAPIAPELLQKLSALALDEVVAARVLLTLTNDDAAL